MAKTKAPAYRILVDGGFHVFPERRAALRSCRGGVLHSPRGRHYRRGDG
ncbi:hypothetical protein [Paenibacillus konkukensis]|nr:hypothetical protein [Paenibacillus konkukensis]